MLFIEKYESSFKVTLYSSYFTLVLLSQIVPIYLAFHQPVTLNSSIFVIFADFLLFSE